VGLEPGGNPVGLQKKSHGQVGAGAPEAHCIEAALVQLPGAVLQHPDVRLPGADRVRLGEAYGPAHRVPELREIGFAEDLRRPARGREGDDRPGHAAAVEGRPHRAPEIGQHGVRHALGVDPGKEVGLRIGDGVDHGRPALRLLLDPLQHPRRSPADGLLGCVRRSLPADVQVDVERLDAPRPLPVRNARDRADERRMLDVREKRQALATLEIHPDAEREPRVLLELLLAPSPESLRVHRATVPT
jgi:hypothetical protein